MERVELKCRPGQFFVVCRALGHVRLLDGDREFSVPLDQVKVRDARAKVTSQRRHSVKSQVPLVDDFSRYHEFIQFLLKHRERVHVYFACHGAVIDRLVDRYLDTTSEELDERFIFKTTPESWKAYNSRIVFPVMPREILTPSKRMFDKSLCDSQEYIYSVKFAWFLIERHGFRVTRKYLRDAEGKEICVETR